jgi:hypothetical protein
MADTQKEQEEQAQEQTQTPPSSGRPDSKLPGANSLLGCLRLPGNLRTTLISSYQSGVKKERNEWRVGRCQLKKSGCVAKMRPILSTWGYFRK